MIDNAGLTKFKPRRDVPLFITIPSDLCYELIDSHDVKWCEIFVPPDSVQDLVNDSLWSTMVVEPEHVFYKENTDYVVFWINAGAKPYMCYKQRNADDKRIICNSECAYSEEIQARFLQWEYFRRDKDFREFAMNNNIINAKAVVYDSYKKSGQTMYDFIRSLGDLE